MVRLRLTAPDQADVIIAGAGPAGCAAAARLAAGGARVLLLDQRTFPRDKVCGDFVGPTALVELEALGVTARPEYATTNVVRHAALFLDGRELIRRRLPEVDQLPPYGRCIPRFLLDSWLLDASRAAGARVMEGWRVTGFDVDANAVVVHAEHGGQRVDLRARLLIGADGSSSAIGRELRGASPADENRIIAVRGYYEGMTGPADRADLYFSGSSFPGYYWLFPTAATEANVGVGMLLETWPPTSDHLRTLLLELVASDPALSARLDGARLRGKVVGWPLTTYDPRLPLVSDRVMLVGDAAGFINPLNGEGIQYALVSGRWAAETAMASLAADDCSSQSLMPFADRCERELRYDMALAGLLVQFIRNRHLNGIWLEALKVIAARARVDEEYAYIASGILAGISPARDALSVKVVGRTLDQALYSTILAVAWTVLKGPGHLTHRSAELARTGAATATTLLTDPAALMEWVVGLAKQSGELALQFGGHLTDAHQLPVLPPPLYPPTAHVRIAAAS